MYAPLWKHPLRPWKQRFDFAQHFKRGWAQDTKGMRVCHARLFFANVAALAQRSPAEQAEQAVLLNVNRYVARGTRLHMAYTVSHAVFRLLVPRVHARIGRIATSSRNRTQGA